MILIFGCPRSGTTWLGKIFDSHPDTFYLHEPDSVLFSNEIPIFVPRDDVEKYKEAAIRYVGNLLKIRSVKVLGKFPLFEKNYLSSAEQVALKYLIYFDKVRERMLGVRRSSIPFSGRVAFMQGRAVWKSIESPGRLGLFLRTIPASLGVLIIRHPGAQIESVLRGEAQGGLPSEIPASEDYDLFAKLLHSSQSQERGLTLEGLRKMHPIERLAIKWVLYNEKAMCDVSGLPNARVVRFEDLCANPIDVAQELFKFGGLAWNQQTQAFVEESTTRSDNRYHSVYKKSGESVNRWRQRLSESDIARVESIVKDSLPGRYYDL